MARCNLACPKELLGPEGFREYKKGMRGKNPKEKAVTRIYNLSKGDQKRKTKIPELKEKVKGGWHGKGVSSIHGKRTYNGSKRRKEQKALILAEERNVAAFLLLPIREKALEGLIGRGNEVQGSDRGKVTEIQERPRHKITSPQ